MTASSSARWRHSSAMRPVRDWPLPSGGKRVLPQSTCGRRSSFMPGLGVMKGNGPILATPILRPNAAGRADDADTFVFAGVDGVHGRVVSRALTGRIGAWRGRIIGDAFRVIWADAARMMLRTSATSASRAATRARKSSSSWLAADADLPACGLASPLGWPLSRCIQRFSRDPGRRGNSTVSAPAGRFGQFFEKGLDRRNIGKAMQAFAIEPQLASRLRPAQHEHG